MWTCHGLLVVEREKTIDLGEEVLERESRLRLGWGRVAADAKRLLILGWHYPRRNWVISPPLSYTLLPLIPLDLNRSRYIRLAYTPRVQGGINL
jgi:hypothetical protein